MAEVLLAEPLLGKADQITRLLGMVDDSGIIILKMHIDRALECFSYRLADRFDTLLHLVSGFGVIASNSSLHEGIIREDVVGMAAREVANGEHNVFSAVEVSRLNYVQSDDNL